MADHKPSEMLRKDPESEISDDQAIDLLKELYPDERPSYNNRSSVTLGERSVVFDGFRELERLVDNYEHLTEEQARCLASIPWFPDFLQCSLVCKSNSGVVSATCDDIAKLIVLNFPNEMPTFAGPKLIKDENNRTVMLNPASAMEKIAARWNTSEGPRPETKDLLMSTPWGRRWVDVYVKRADTYRRTRSVSKNAKIKLLQIYYPKQPPTWLDEVPIIIEDNSVWVFRPTHFMDDIADSWLGGKVVLSESEKQEMEKLSWFEKWISNIANRRKRKKCNMSNDDI